MEIDGKVFCFCSCRGPDSEDGSFHLTSSFYFPARGAQSHKQPDSTKTGELSFKPNELYMSLFGNSEIVEYTSRMVNRMRDTCTFPVRHLGHSWECSYPIFGVLLSVAQQQPWRRCTFCKRAPARRISKSASANSKGASWGKKSGYA